MSDNFYSYITCQRHKSDSAFFFVKQQFKLILNYFVLKYFFLVSEWQKNEKIDESGSIVFFLRDLYANYTLIHLVLNHDFRPLISFYSYDQTMAERIRPHSIPCSNPSHRWKQETRTFAAWQSWHRTKAKSHRVVYRRGSHSRSRDRKARPFEYE